MSKVILLGFVWIVTITFQKEDDQHNHEHLKWSVVMERRHIDDSVTIFSRLHSII